MFPGKWKEWEIIDELGTGSYGSVYEISKDGIHMAVKIIEIPRKEEYGQILKDHGEGAAEYCQSIAQDFQTEIDTLKTLEHCDNIIHIRDSAMEQKADGIGWTIYIFMDSLTPLTDYAVSSMFEEKDVINLAIEITSALDACEKAGIIHRDIKPENILVDDQGNYILCDFGLARKLSFKQQANSVKGTYKYMAPEIYHGQNYGHSVDIYSLGLILYQYMNRRRSVFLPLDKSLIYYKDEETALEKRMENAVIPPPADASEEFADIILRMIKYRPEDRYQSAEKILRDLTLLKKGKYRKHRKKCNWKCLIIPAAILLLCIPTVKILVPKIQDIKQETNDILINISCGEEAVCSLDAEGTLTISGKGVVGPTEDYSLYPWDNDKDNIKKIIIKEGITGIGDSAFLECLYLLSVSMPDSMETIGDEAFWGCELLSEITFPENISQIGLDAFKGTKWLDENEYAEVDGILLHYPEDEESVVLPQTIRVINDAAFEENQSVKSITFSDSLTEIHNMAFKNCRNLKEVNNLKDTTKIGFEAFDNTPWLRNLASMNKGFALVGTTLLAYYGQEDNLHIPDEVQTITGCAFEGNDDILSITIDNNVTELGESCFYDIPRLKKVVFNNSKIREIPDDAFSDCANLTEINIPESVESIGRESFYRCTDLKTITLPSGIKEIGKSAFEECTSLVEVLGLPEDMDREMIDDAFIGTWWWNNVYNKE